MATRYMDITTYVDVFYCKSSGARQISYAISILSGILGL